MAKILEDADKLIKSGCPEKALSTLEKQLACQALPIEEKLQAFDLYGKALVASGRFQDAQLAFENACLLSETLHEKGQVGADLLIRSLENCAHAYSRAGQYKEAAAKAAQAVELARKEHGQEHPKYAEALFHLADPFYHLKEYGKAKDLLEQALAIWQKQKQPLPQTGFCLNNLGRIFEETGDIEKGIRYHAEAVACRRKLPSLTDLAFSLGNYGIALVTGGMLQEGMAAIKESLQTYSEAGAENCADAIALRENLNRLKHYIGNIQ